MSYEPVPVASFASRASALGIVGQEMDVYKLLKSIVNADVAEWKSNADSFITLRPALEPDLQIAPGWTQVGDNRIGHDPCCVRSLHSAPTVTFFATRGTYLHSPAFPLPPILPQ